MKQITAKKLFTTLAMALLLNIADAQNLIVNPGFTDGTTNWSTDCSMEIYAESVYGGTSSTNNVTEIDGERCFNQAINVSAGATYYVTYKASRRQGGSTPATVGVNVTITGLQSANQYINVDRTYTNTSWSYTTEVFSFTVPLNSNDAQVNVKFGNYVTVGTYGTIIDDISVSTGSAGILPIRFLSFSGKLNTNTAILKWSASNDDQSGKLFIIEKSTTQNKFDSIGSVKATDTRASYTFTDNNATNSANYYRIKAVNANGSISYTNVIALNSSNTASAKLYPNPAINNISVSIPAAANIIATVQIFNLTGNLVACKQVTLTEGLNIINLDVTSLKPGSFVLKIANSEVNFAQSFCKR